MKQYGQIFALGSLLLILMACTMVRHKLIVIRPPSCPAICQQHLQSCRMDCDNSCYNCSTKSDAQVTKHYLNYFHKVDTQGQPVTHELNSYQDPLQCRKTSCDCAADYSVCVQSCQGKIKKRLQVAPICH